MQGLLVLVRKMNFFFNNRINHERTFVRLSKIYFGTYEGVLSFNEGNISKCQVMEELGMKVCRHLLEATKRADSDRVRRTGKHRNESRYHKKTTSSQKEFGRLV